MLTYWRGGSPMINFYSLESECRLDGGIEGIERIMLGLFGDKSISLEGSQSLCWLCSLCRPMTIPREESSAINLRQHCVQMGRGGCSVIQRFEKSGHHAPVGVTVWRTRTFPNRKELRGQDLNLRPSGYEPDELPGCSTPRLNWSRPNSGGKVSEARERHLAACGEISKRQFTFIF